MLAIWNRAKIPTAFQPNMVSKLKGSVEEYNLIKKNIGRQSATQESREKAFLEKIKLVFVTAHKEAKQILKTAEDKQYLMDQRGIRMMKIASIDQELTKKEDHGSPWNGRHVSW